MPRNWYRGWHRRVRNALLIPRMQEGDNIMWQNAALFGLAIATAALSQWPRTSWKIAREDIYKKVDVPGNDS